MNVYKMLAINLDGALLSSKRKIHKETKSLLRQVVYKGIDVFFFTTQGVQFASHIIKQFPCRLNFISNYGSVIVYNREKPVVLERIKNSEALDIIRILENMDCQIRIVNEDRIIANRFFPTKNNAEKLKWEKNDYSFYVEQYMEYVSQYCIVEKIDPLQIEVYFADKADIADAISAINSIALVNICQQAALKKLVIVPKQIDFVSTVNNVRKKKRLAWSEIVVVGSSDLDVGLMERAGLSVATANSSWKVKQYARWVTRSNDDLGLYYVVNEVFRYQQPLHLLKKIKTNKLYI